MYLSACQAGWFTGSCTLLMSALAASSAPATTIKERTGRLSAAFGNSFVGLPPVCTVIPKKKSAKRNTRTTNEKADKLETVKRWVLENIKESTRFSTKNIIVLEVSCFDPGCVPIETVVMLSVAEQFGASDAPRSKIKIFKPVKEVIETDVREIFKNVLKETEDPGVPSIENSNGNQDISALHAVDCPCCDPYSDYVAGMYGDF